MAKYSKKSQDKVRENMEEMKDGKLHSGSGKKVTNPKQAIAIGLSEARKSGTKVPAKKSSDTPAQRGRKPGTKNAAPKKSAAKKAPAKKRGRPAENSAPKKSPAKKRGRPSKEPPQKRGPKPGSKNATKKSGTKRGRPAGSTSTKKSAPKKANNKRERKSGK